MTAKAYVLIETAVGKTRDVVQSLKEMGGTLSVDAVTGPYDVIAVVEGADLPEVGDVVTKRIHTVAGVIRTVTCLAIGTR